MFEEPTEDSGVNCAGVVAWVEIKCGFGHTAIVVPQRSGVTGLGISRSQDRDVGSQCATYPVSAPYCSFDIPLVARVTHYMRFVTVVS